MEDLEEKWNELRLLDEERNEINIDDDDVPEELRKKEQRSLMAKLYSARLINKEMLETTLGKIWRISKEAVFTEFPLRFPIQNGRSCDKYTRPYRPMNVINELVEDEFTLEARYDFTAAILKLMAQRLKDILEALDKEDGGTKSEKASMIKKHMNFVTGYLKQAKDSSVEAKEVASSLGLLEPEPLGTRGIFFSLTSKGTFVLVKFLIS
ncbi:hypothetical protein F2P56_008700 [Juglans regia]|uniref:Uncharacterized protein n=1 Tax=Juglans regia TaxID=51240 RepID=A0A833XV39_JUGRE|nr:hypothetical protein F2P56_008700 [Juglans regia]